MTQALAIPSSKQIEWCQPKTADEAWRLAETIAETNLAPKDFKTPAAIFIVMQHGAELGLNPMQALQNIALVNNRPAVWGTLVQALVQRSGIVKRRIQGALEMTTVKAIAEGKWAGRTEGNAALVDALAVRLADRLADLKERGVKLPPNYLCGYGVFQIGDDIHVQIFDSAHAQTAGLLGKSGPWTQYPDRMHQHRAVTYLSRDTCGAALTGLAGQPTVEEMMDMPGAIDVPADEVKPAPSTAARIVDMSATPAGAPPAAPPVERDADNKAAAAARLKASIARLLSIPWRGGEAMSADEHRDLVTRTIVDVFGEPKRAAAMSPEERMKLAAALDAIKAPPQVAVEPEPEVGDEPEAEDKTNF